MMKQHEGWQTARRRAQRGSTIFESLAALVLLFFILFAMLQICRWCLTRQICQYSAYYGAKGIALGYRPNLALRAARVAGIAISGPNEGSFDDNFQAATQYMSYGDASGVRYSYWFKKTGDSPLLQLNGSWTNGGVRGEVTLKNAPLLEDSALGTLLGITKNPEPSAAVESRNYASIYLEE